MDELIKPFRMVSPGEIIMRMMKYMGWNQTDLSEITGLSDKTISCLLKNKYSITPATAELLGEAFSKSPDFFIRLSANYQLSKKDEDAISRAALAKAKAQMHTYMPVAEMKRKGWFVSKVSSISEIENEYERVFGQRALPTELFEGAPTGMAARQTRDDSEYTKYYRTTWFSFAKMHARNIVGTMKNETVYDAAVLRDIAQNLYSYTLMPDGVERILSDLMERAGVNFFVLSHLSKTYLDGAAFMEGNKPFIVYTGRYDRVDNFWFVIAHEVAHVIRHYEFLQNPFLDDMEDSRINNQDNREKEADEMAGVFLRQQEVLRYKGQINRYVTEERLCRISRAANVSVPVALGMLQHAGAVPWSQFSKYKPKVMQKIPLEYIKG